MVFWLINYSKLFYFLMYVNGFFFWVVLFLFFLFIVLFYRLICWLMCYDICEDLYMMLKFIVESEDMVVVYVWFLERLFFGVYKKNFKFFFVFVIKVFEFKFLV